MDKASIKSVSACELESAIAEVLNRLTGRRWAVDIGALSFPKDDAVDAVLFGGREHLQLSLTAQEVVPSPLDSL